MSETEWSTSDRVRRWRAQRRAANLPVFQKEAKRAYRKEYRKRDYVRERRKLDHREWHASRPFMGVDGEGCGTDALGRQHYMLMRAGDRQPLYTGKPLSTVECLGYLCDCPPEPVLVGFSFGYDVTMILRDLPKERLKRLFSNKPFGPGKSRYTSFRGFGIEYLQRQYFRVCRQRRVTRISQFDGQAYETVETIPGTSRTVHETIGFFQMKFVQAIEAFEVGKEQADFISQKKDERATFDEITPDIIRYCGLECQLLAAMMEKFRQDCFATGIRPKRWSGGGQLAAALHGLHGTMKTSVVNELLPRELLDRGRAAYFGGRFEVFRTGQVDGPIYSYDINSAYPAAMRSLPCLEHGVWKEVSGRTLRGLPAGSLYVANVRFKHVGDSLVCGLPVRVKGKRLIWPREGAGTYWSVELEAAAKLGCRVKHETGWLYEKRCDCQMFDWIEPLYAYRKSLGKSMRGQPIKVAINSLYGKLAQRIGNPVYANFVWAGLVTASTRAMLLEAAALNPDAICMIATDGIFSRKPLDLSLLSELGAWDRKEHPYLFIVQPGLYFGAGRPKTRGMAASVFVKPDGGLFSAHTDRFIKAWAEYAEADRAVGAGYVPPPTVPVQVKLFIGLRLAYARGKPETAGRWETPMRNISFNWHPKREPGEWETPLCRWTRPAAGGPDLVSMAYDGEDELVEAWDLAKAELDDQGDYVIAGFQDHNAL